MERPHPTFTGRVWICPECRWPWNSCDCADGAKCRAPSASAPVQGRSARKIVGRR